MTIEIAPGASILSNHSTAASSAYSSAQSSVSGKSENSTSGDVLGNHGKAKVRAARITRIKSIVLASLNVILLILTYHFLVVSFAFQLGHYDETAEKLLSITFIGNHTIHPDEDLVMLQVFRNASDTGTFLWFNSSSIRVTQVDSGMSHFIGVHTKDELVFLSPHGCEGVNGGIEGILALYCYVNSTTQEPEDCHERCIESSDTYGTHISEMVYEDNFTVTELYKTMNSLGFGVVSVEEHLTNVELIDFENETYRLSLNLDSKSRSNAQETYDIPWQDILLYLIMVDITINFFGRLMTVPVLISGIKIRKTKVLVKADLSGGMFTSPGRSFVMFLLVVVFGAQNYLFIDAGHYDHDIVSHFWTTAAVASMSSILLTIMFSRTEFRFFVSGTMLFLIAGAGRAMTLETIENRAQTAVREIGQVLERDCTLFYSNHTPISSVRCNVAEEIGMSGLEILYRVLFEPVVVTILLVFALEVFIVAMLVMRNIVKDCKKSRRIAASTFTRGSSYASLGLYSNRAHRTKTSAQSTIQGVSDYDKCVLLSNMGHSIFSRTWSSPIMTILGKFTHASTSIEDDLVMYGPLLVRINWFPYMAFFGKLFGKENVVKWVIQHKLYIGVLCANSKLASCRENGQKITNYITEYNYKEMPDLLNGEPLQ